MSHEERLNEIIAVFLQALDAGQSPNRQELLASHPDLAEELTAFFADHDRLHEIADPLRPAGELPLPPAEAPTLGLESGPPTDGLLSTVRYFGDYELVEEIARGGMGVVYKARQVSLNRVVALKMILAGQLASLADVQRFHAEAEAAANLDHPNIMPIYEVGEYEGQHYFSMKLVEDGSLAGKLNGTPLPPRDAAALLESLARAMCAAHQNGVIHRDLKPANILLTPDGTPMISDFGLARKLDDIGMTATGAILGTPSYMAPEQAGGKSKELGPACDIYALGAILYECLTGRPPFKAATALDTLVQVASDDPVPPTALNAQVPRDLETICLKCLSKEPAKRYAAASELADDLRRFLANEPIRARPVGPAERVVKWVKRRPTVAALSAVLAAVIMVAFAAVTAAMFQANEERTRAQDRGLQLQDANDELTREQGVRAAAERVAKNRADEAERGSYLNGVGLAAQLARDGDLRRARQVLAECPDAYRRWEWNYLDRLCRGERLALPSQAGMVTGLAYSPDGKYVAVASSGNQIEQAAGAEGSVTLYETESGRQIFRHPQIGGMAFRSIAFSPDGKHLAALERETGLNVYGVPSGETERSFSPRDGGLLAVGYTNAGRLLAASYLRRSKPDSDMATLVVWDVGTEKEVARLPGFAPPRGVWLEVVAVAFSPDGRRVAALAANIGMVRSGSDPPKPRETPDAPAGGEPRPAPEPPQEKPLEKTPPAPGKAEQSPPGSAGQLKVWDLEGHRLERTFEAMPAMFGSLSFSHDGCRLAWGDGLTVAEVDLTAERPPRKLLGHRSDVHTVAYGPDDRLLYSAGGDKAIRCWDIATGVELFALHGHTDAVIRLACSPDGKLVASGTGNMFARTSEVKLWDAADPTAHTLRAAPRAISWSVISPDGRWTALSSIALDGGAGNSFATKVIDITGERPPVALQSPSSPRGPFSGVFNGDGTLYATFVASDEGPSPMVFDARTGKVRTSWSLPKEDGLGEGWPSLAFDRDGRRIVLAWVTGTRPHKEKREVAPEVCVRILDVESGQILREFKQAVFADAPAVPAEWTVYLVMGLAYGGRIAASVVRVSLNLSTFGESEVLVWDPETQERARSYSFNHVVAALHFDARDERLVATGSDVREGWALVWDVASGREVLSLRGHSRPILGATFSRDGKRVVTAGGDGLIKLWDADTGREVLTLSGHTRPVTAVAFTLDGRRLISATGLETLDAFTGAASGSVRVPAEVKVWDAGR
jgi:eukaryotic-like serine/threonine-protein kinase